MSLEVLWNQRPDPQSLLLIRRHRQGVGIIVQNILGIRYFLQHNKIFFKKTNKETNQKLKENIKKILVKLSSLWNFSTKLILLE